MKDRPVMVVLTGPPACGKTQVCREYATAVFEARLARSPDGLYLPVLFWKAGSVTELAGSLRDSLRNMRNPAYLKQINPDLTLMHVTEQVSQHNLDRLLKEVLDTLKDKYKKRPASEKMEEWLVIIDGAFSYDQLERLMSPLFKCNTTRWGRGRLLIAVQDHLAVRHPCTMEISLGPGMSPVESLHFLRLFFPDDREEDLQNVAKQLAYIPLSLAVAAETMKSLRDNDASYTWQTHLEKNLLPSDSADVHASDPRHPKNLHCNYDQTLYQALKQAVKRIGVEGNNAELFFLLGLCEEGTVPLQLIKKLAVALLVDEPEEGTEDALFVQFKEDIHHNSLLLLDGDAGISVHHVLHVVLRDSACAQLKGSASAAEQQFGTRHKVSAIIKALCSLYEATEQQSKASYLDSVMDKLQLLPHFVAVFRTCVQSCGFQDATVPRFALYAAKLLQLRREGSEVRNALEIGIATTSAMKESIISAEIDLKSLYAKELIEAREFSSAIKLLHKNIEDRKKSDHTNLDQLRRNFAGLHGDLIALGYAFKDRGEEGDLVIAEKHVDEVFELLHRGRTDMADDSNVNQMHSEALLLRAQLYQDLARYDPSLIDELLRACGVGATPSHHNCQVLRTLTDLLLDGPQPDVSKASLLIDRAVDMGHRLYGDLHPMIAFSMMTKGRVLLELDKSEEALIVLMGAQNMNDRLPVEVREDTIIPLIHFFRGECYIQQGRYKEACDVLQISAEQTKMSKVGFGPGHPQNAVVLDKLGLVCIHLGQLEEAKQYIEQSLTLKMRIRGNSHPALRWNYEQLENIAYEYGNDDEAGKFRALKLSL